MADIATNQPGDAASPEQPQAPNLTLQDLVMFAQIIQLSTQRGAFRAEELENVGTLYNKLIAFLQISGVLTPVAEADPQSEEK